MSKKSIRIATAACKRSESIKKKLDRIEQSLNKYIKQ